MKPTERQKKVCEAIMNQISYWQTSNDITSPTHDTDIEDCLWAELEGVITDRDIHNIERELEKLLQYIRRVENVTY